MEATGARRRAVRAWTRISSVGSAFARSRFLMHGQAADVAVRAPTKCPTSVLTEPDAGSGRET